MAGLIPETLNSTFITLIPKFDRPASFGDYRPIALCNLLYKLITKIIAERLNPFLGHHIFPGQFDFLHDHQILDAVGIVHEVFQSAKSKRHPTVFLKLDIEKAYDKVNRSMLRMTLLQIGSSFELVKWMRSCVT